MASIREGKVAVVDAVRARLDEADAAVITEYRGLTVAEMASLRRNLRAVGGDFKVFKNTLVRRAIAGSPHEPLTGLLEGPTAIAFVSGDVSAVAKALRDFARGAPALIVKGGVLDGSLLGAPELGALADLPSRDVLLAMFAGAIAAPMRTMAGLLKAVPQSLAYGLSALIESRGGVPAPPEAAPTPGADASGDDGGEAVQAPSPTEAAVIETGADPTETTIEPAQSEPAQSETTDSETTDSETAGADDAGSSNGEAAAPQAPAAAETTTAPADAPDEPKSKDTPTEG